MGKYVAAGKVVTDICWNGIPETSEVLEVFFVKPEIKVNRFGKKKITGFQEIITGDKIINRRYIPNEYIGYDPIDEDVMIDGEVQIGDVVWNVIEESEPEFEELLTPEEIQKYMSFSPKEIREQLKSFREEARAIGQGRENLELKHNKRYIKRNLDPEKVYVAIPRTVIDIYWNEVSETSEPLGMFYVKPEVKRNAFGQLVVTGFKEVITGEKIVNREYYESDDDSIVEDKDCLAGEVTQIGDVVWNIIDKSPADRIVTAEEMQEYMSLTPTEILKRFKILREKARTVALNQQIEFDEKNYRYRGNMNSNEIYIAIPSVIVDKYLDGSYKKSESDEIFIVRPEIRKNIFGMKSVTGFKEVITGEKIVNSTFHSSEYETNNEDKDCMVDGEPEVGDLAWDIIDKSTADRLLPKEVLAKYMSYSPEEILEQLRSFRLMASSVVNQYRNNRNIVRVMRKSTNKKGI